MAYKPDPQNLVFRAGAVLEPLVKARTDRGADMTEHAVAKRDLERYYAILTDTHKLTFTPEEAALMEYILEQGEPVNYRILWAEVAEADKRFGLSYRFKADGLALAKRIRDLHTAELWATLDALERSQIMRRKGMSREEALAAVDILTV